MDDVADLERRASAGEPEARFTLGTRLLAEIESPEAFTRGAGLVEAAAESGHAEALCQLATLEAIGAGRRQNWGRALDCLASAAEGGAEQARGQLRVLAAAAGAPPAEVEAEAPAWAELRARLDVERLLRVPDREAISDTPRLRVFRGLADPIECRWVIAKLRPRLGPALVWDGLSGVGKVDPSRSNSAVELRLPEMDVVLELLRARIARATHLPETIFEVPQIMHYAVGQEFTPHHDFLDPEQPGHKAGLARRGQRIGTFLIYLNEDFEGGETEFPSAGLSYRGRTGDALFFANVTPDGRPDPLTLHAGRPPVKGEKWIFSQWIRGRPPTAPRPG